jgi:sodium/hydrogen antiporter
MDRYPLFLAGLGAVVLLVAWLPMLVRKLPLSLPIFCVAFGYALFSIPGTGAKPDPIGDSLIIEKLTEGLVIIALTGAGLKIGRPLHWPGWKLTWRLLAVTMPLSIAAMALLGWGMLGLAAPAALLLGAALAPTDPVLASDIQITKPETAEDDEIRFSLTSEAGLNDGLAFPFTNLAIAVGAAGLAPGMWLVEWLAVDVVWKLAAGVAMGCLIGRLLATLLFRLPKMKRLADTQDGFVAIGITFLSYGATELIHGYGFVAVFVTALVLRQQERRREYHERMHDFAEQTERLLMMCLLVMFGGSLAGGLLDSLTWPDVGFAVACLFLIRPLTGLVALAGMRTPLDERLAISFFGIRGIGSFYYLSYAINHTEIPQAHDLWSIVGLVVLMSIVIHGVSVTPIMDAIERRRDARKLVHPRVGE